MLSKHASLSIKWSPPYSTLTVPTLQFFQADLFVYTVCNRFGVLRYRDVCPFCPFWTELGHCCPLYILFMRGIKTPVIRYCFISTTHQSSSATVWATFCELKWVCCTKRGPFISLMISWKHKGLSVHPVCIKELCFMPQEINTRWDVRAENVRQPFHWYCEHEGRTRKLWYIHLGDVCFSFILHFVKFQQMFLI